MINLAFVRNKETVLISVLKLDKNVSLFNLTDESSGNIEVYI